MIDLKDTVKREEESEGQIELSIQVVILARAESLGKQDK